MFGDQKLWNQINGNLCRHQGGEQLKKVKILNFAAETNKLMLGTGLK